MEVNVGMAFMTIRYYSVKGKGHGKRLPRPGLRLRALFISSARWLNLSSFS